MVCILTSMKARKRKPKAPVDLHLRVWDGALASFIIKEADEHRRPMTNQIVLMLEKGMGAMLESNDGR